MFSAEIGAAGKLYIGDYDAEVAVSKKYYSKTILPNYYYLSSKSHDFYLPF